MHKFHKNIEVYWFVTILLLQVFVVILFYRFFGDRPYLFILVSSFFLTMLFMKMRDLFVRPLESINKDIELFREGTTSRIGSYGEHFLFEVLSQFFDAMMQVLSGVRDEYLAGKVLFDDVSHASELQKFMIGKKHKIISGMEIIGCTRSAKEINGDSYDFFERDNQCYIYVGDATGHGVASGMVGTMTNALVEAYGHTLVEGDKVLTEVNKLLYPRLHGGRIMTLALLRWDTTTKRLLLTGAGHEHLLVWRASEQKLEVYRSEGIALGMRSDISEYTKERIIPFDPGDVFILYSDGITEAVTTIGGRRTTYGFSRLKKAIENTSVKNPAGFFRKITEDVSIFMGKESFQRDDMTLLCGSISDAKGVDEFPQAHVPEGFWNW